MRAVNDRDFSKKQSEFEEYTAARAPDILRYVQKNWLSCAHMWAGSRRDKHFTAGNTTTNRIESNWNQLKTLLGKKSSIDNCVVALWQHVARILTSYQQSLTLFSVRSRAPYTCPTFLDAVQRILSEFALNKVREEYDRAVVDGDSIQETSGEPRSTPIANSFWFSDWNGDKVMVDSGQWTCTCPRFTSLRLPCRHIILAARRNLQLHKLPRDSIPCRWNMDEAMQLSTTVTTTVESLKSIESPDVLPPRPTHLDAQRSSGTISYRSIPRGQQNKMPVLSECEKYNIVQADLEPLVSALKNSPSSLFFSRIEQLQQTVQNLLDSWTLSALVAGGAETLPDEQLPTEPINYDEIVLDGELGVDLNPDAAATAANETSESVARQQRVGQQYARDYDDKSGVEREPGQSVREGGDHHAVADNVTREEFNVANECFSGGNIDEDLVQSIRAVANPSQVSLLDLVPPTLSQSQVEHLKDNFIKLQQAPPPSVTRKLMLSVPAKQIQKIVLPPVKQRGNLRKGTGNQARLRLLQIDVAEQTSCPVSLRRLLLWAKHHSNVQRVAAVMEQYPLMFDAPRFATCSLRVVQKNAAHAGGSDSYSFIIPSVLARRMKSAIEDAKPKSDVPQTVDDFSSDSAAGEKRSVYAILLGDAFLPFTL